MIKSGTRLKAAKPRHDQRSKKAKAATRPKVEKRVSEDVKFDTIASQPLQSTMDYSKKTCEELKAICRERKIKGFSGKSKSDLIQ